MELSMIATWYAAGLSTVLGVLRAYEFVEARRPRVRVAVDHVLVRGEPEVMLQAVNVGNRPVELNSVSLIFSDGHQWYDLPVIEVSPDFPCRVEPEACCALWLSAAQVLEHEVKAGARLTSACFGDYAGRRYRGEFCGWNSNEGWLPGPIKEDSC